MGENGPVLIYQIGSLGDTIVSIPSYRAIRRHFKGRRTLLLEARLKEGRVMPSDLLIREGLIDGVASYVHKTTGSALKGQFDAWRAVVSHHPSAAVYLAPSPRAASQVKRDKVFFQLCGVSELVGFHPVDLTPFAQRDKDGYLVKMPHESRLRLSRLLEDGIEFREDDFNAPLLTPSIEDRMKALDWLTNHRVHPERKLVAIGFMTAQEVTRWPLDRFQELGRRLLDTGQVELLVTGGPADKLDAERLTTSWGDGIVAAGEFGIHDMGAILSLTDLYIGLDTGTTHLAAAVRANILALYADNNQPGEWSPMVDSYEIVSHRVPCGGCRINTCKVTGHPCMAGITVDRVFEAALKRLETVPA